jgi:hypothetical protein
MGVVLNGYRPSDRQTAFWAVQAGPNVVCIATNSAGPETGADLILKNPTRGLAMRRPLLLFFPQASFGFGFSGKREDGFCRALARQRLEVVEFLNGDATEQR